MFCGIRYEEGYRAEPTDDLIDMPIGCGTNH